MGRRALNGRPMEGAVLDVARRRGVVTRPELAATLGVTPATITNVVTRLLAAGLLVETGYSASTGGKRRSLLELNASSGYAVGVSSDETKLTIVFTDLNGVLVGRAVTPVDTLKHATSFEDAAADTLKTLARTLSVKLTAVVGIGVAGGEQQLSHWLPEADEHETMTERLRRATGMPVVSRDEATCAALGEYWTGAVAPDTVFATVYMDAYVTAGFVVRGSAYDGVPRGSLGHVSIDRLGPPCVCGRRGCVNVVASPAAVVRTLLRNEPELAQQLNVRGRRAEVLSDLARMAHAAAMGERSCARILVDAAHGLAAGIADMAAVLGLEKVFLAGPGFSDGGAMYHRIIHTDLCAWTPAGTAPVDVILSMLDHEAAAIGAASLVLQTTLGHGVPREGQSSTPDHDG